MLYWLKWVATFKNGSVRNKTKTFGWWYSVWDKYDFRQVKIWMLMLLGKLQLRRFYYKQIRMKKNLSWRLLVWIKWITVRALIGQKILFKFLLKSNQLPNPWTVPCLKVFFAQLIHSYLLYQFQEYLNLDKVHHNVGQFQISYDFKKIRKKCLVFILTENCIKMLG